MSQKIDVSDLVTATFAAVTKGDKPGHAFRGNQWTRGGGGQAGPVAASKIAASKEATQEAKLQTESALDEIGKAAKVSADDLPARDLVTAKRAVQQDLVQARSMAASAFSIQEGRLNGRNDRSMSSASDKVAKNDYANRIATYAKSMDETASNLKRNGVFPQSKAFEVDEFVDSVQNAAAQLADAARILKEQP